MAFYLQLVVLTDKGRQNLQENPNAVFMIMEPGKTSADWRGIRVYLTMKKAETSGENSRRLGPKLVRGQGRQQPRGFTLQ
jgi:hypothetical protein